MLVKMLAVDTFALDFARRVLKADSVLEDQGDVLVLVSKLGENKTVGVYSLPNDLMFHKRLGKYPKRLAVSVYTPSPLTDVKLPNDNMSVKRLNSALRQQVQPRKLYGCDVFVALNQDAKLETTNEFSVLRNILSICKVNIPNHLSQRGGAVAYTYLPSSRLITPLTTKAGDAKYVWYGTSGLHNIAELVLTMKTAAHLGLPCVFDSYEQAVGSSTQTGDVYRRAMGLFAKKLTQALGINIPLELLPTENTLSPFMDKSLISLAEEIQTELGHPVNLLHAPDGTAIKTDNIRFGGTLGKAFANGCWAGGALLYYAFYSTGKHTPFVAVLYDGAKGGVHRIAKRFMTEPNKLWVCPVGSMSVYAKDTNTFIDPWDLLRLLDTWNKDVAEGVLRDLWSVAVTPLPIQQIGVKHVVEVGLNGLKVSIETAGS